MRLAYAYLPSFCFWVALAVVCYLAFEQVQHFIERLIL